MAGHNKWSKVKHIRTRVDAIKGRVFSKCVHEVALAARAGGGDPGTKARPRTAIDNAKSVSMPKENIERALRKGTGELGGEMNFHPADAFCCRRPATARQILKLHDLLDDYPDTLTCPPIPKWRMKS